MQTTVTPQHVDIYKYTCGHTKTETKPCEPGRQGRWERTVGVKCDDCTTRQKADLARAQAGRPVYIRFGAAPECGYSWNDRDNYHEEGISVYAAWLLDDDTIILDMRDADLCSYVFGEFQDRPAYLATGTVVGTGADGEPLLADIDTDPINPTAIEYII
jgi:hypothetical protein